MGPWPANPEFKQKVEELLRDNQVLLFMKGTPEMPRCGFSMRVVGVLEQLGVEYGAVDVLPLLDPLREVTGEISDWRTFPQLYVNGELVGGCDIVEEMFESGELAELLGVEQPGRGAPQAPAPQQARPEPAAESSAAGRSRPKRRRCSSATYVRRQRHTRQAARRRSARLGRSERSFG